MNSITLSRILKNGLLNYKRNFWLSSAATAVMVITLFIITTLVAVSSLTNISLQSIKDKVDISVYFNLTTSEQSVLQIQRQVELLPEVSSVIYIPPVTAREKFIELHKDEPLLIESVNQFSDEENPFPASFAIRVHELDDYPAIISLFQQEKFEPFVKKITDKRDVVSRINQITTGIRNFGFVLAVVFGLITILVMFNTIRLTIFNRREEIEIMRLVGAGNWYIRGPFLVEGILYGLAGTVITAVIILPLMIILTPKISRFLELNLAQTSYFGLNSWILLAIQLIIGLLLGIVSSVIVIRRYLKI